MFPEYKDSNKVDQTFNDYMSGKLSRYLSETVLDESNTITYRSLNILDDDGDREVRTNGIEANKVLFVEKDAAFRAVNPLGETYGFTVVSGGGQCNTAAIEDLANLLDPHTRYDFYVLSDFDPSGFGIIDSFRERSERLGIQIDSVQRVGIDPSQVDDSLVHEQRFELPKDDIGWKHALDGKYGLEIEAVSAGTGGGQRLRSLLVDELKPHIRTRERYSRDYQSSVRTVAEYAVETAVNNYIKDLKDHLTEQAEQAAVDLLTGQSGIDIDDAREPKPELLTTDLGELATGDEFPRWLPKTPDGGDLHQAAIDGDEFEIGITFPAMALSGKLQSEIEFDDIGDIVGSDD